MTDEDFKKSGDYLRKNLQKYNMGTSKVTDQYLMSTDPKEIKEHLSVFALKIFKKSISSIKDYYHNINDYLKNKILNEYDEAWTTHLTRLEQAKFQLGISQMTNERAINDFCKDSFNFYGLLKDKVRESVIQSTSQTLAQCVIVSRALKEDKAKTAKTAQQNSFEQNQEQE